MKNDKNNVKKTSVKPKNASGKNAKKTLSKGAAIKIAVASVLLVAVIVTVIVLAFACKDDSPYSDIDLAKHISVAKYFGRELSAKDVADAFEEDKQALIDAYTEYSDPITAGTIEAGHNVTISISAYKYDESKPGKLGDAIKDISIESYIIKDIHQVEIKTGDQTSSDTENNEEEEEEYFPAMQNMLLGTKFDFTPGSGYTNMRTLDYTYPADYSLASLQGVRVIHKVYISTVTTTITPTLNDAFFVEHKDDLGYETYAEYEEYMIGQIKLNLLWNKIVEESKVIALPEDYVNKYYSQYDADIQSYMSQYSITSMTTLYSYLGVTEAEFQQQRKEYAEGTVKEEMILYYIIEKEDISLSDDEYNKILTEIATDSGYDSADDYTEAFGEELTERTVIWEKVKSLILSKAVEVE